MSEFNPAQVSSLERENLQLRRAVEELSILNELSIAISSSHGTDEVIRTIIKRSIKAISAEQGVITLVGDDVSDPTKTLVRTMASSGDREAYSPDQNLLGWMYINRRPLVINDPHNDTRFQGVIWSESVRSLVSVPLQVNSKLVGILTLYNKKRGGEFSVEDQRLLSILAGQSAQVIETARLYEEEKKLATVNQELNLAYEIQTNLLPAKAPVIKGFDVAGMSVPAQSVGGDYFDYIKIDDYHWGMALGDVSGKGMGASLLMANCQATLRGQAQFGLSVHETVERSNHLLSDNIRRGSFVTLFYGVLDAISGQFKFTNAGHNKPYVRRAYGELEMLTIGGLVVGFIGTQKYQEDSIILGPGDTLFIFSDGVPEAMNHNHDQFEEERLEKILKEMGDVSAQTYIDTVHDAVKKHAAGAPQNDDITMLVIKRVN